MTPRSGIKIGRLLGIDIVINVTWLFILLLVAFSFADLFRSTGYDEFAEGASPWVAGLVTAAIFFLCLLLHELAHSIIARRNGISINRITLFMFGGVAEMGEDVKDPGVEFRMAIAGPLLTFVLSGLFFVFYKTTDAIGVPPLIWLPAFTLSWVNLLIGLFNLLPGFPLDGGRLLRSVIWKVTGDMRKATRAASLSGQVFGVALFVVGAVSVMLDMLRVRIPYLPLPNYLGGFWFILIGMFLYRLAQSSYRQTLFRLAVQDTRVRDIMYTEVPLVPEATPLNSLRAHYFATYNLPAFPVTRGTQLIGTVNRDDLSRVAPSEWDILNAGRLARPVTQYQVVSPDTPLDTVMKRLMGGQEFLLVMEGGWVLGIITREGLLRYADMRLKIQPGSRA